MPYRRCLGWSLILTHEYATCYDNGQIILMHSLLVQTTILHVIVGPTGQRQSICRTD
jgi:hypothetical protein